MLVIAVFFNDTNAVYLLLSRAISAGEFAARLPAGFQINGVTSVPDYAELLAPDQVLFVDEDWPADCTGLSWTTLDSWLPGAGSQAGVVEPGS